MRRIVSALVVVAGLVVSSMLLSSATAGGNGEDDNGTTLRLRLVNVAETFIDVGDADFSVGDQSVFRDNAFKRDKKVGSAYGVCTVVRLGATEGVFQCLVTLDLAKGQLTVHGAATFTESEQIDFTLPVTGGSGSYAGAEGEVHVLIRGRESWLRFELDD